MENLIMKLVQTLKSRWGEGRSLAWNPASAQQGVPLWIACGGVNSAVHVLELTSPSTCETRFEGTKHLCVQSCAWSPSGELLAAASFFGTAIFKNIEGQVLELFCFDGAHDNKGTVYSVSWSASGSLIATSGGKDNSICIWKINPGNIESRPLLSTTGSVLAAFAGQDEGISYTEVKHGNCALGSQLPGDRVPNCAWNIEPDDEFELVAYLRGHAGEVNMVQWHPTMDTLFSCSSDHTVKVWAEQDGRNKWQCVQTLGEPHNGHTSIVWALSFNAGGDKMVTCSDDGTLKVWETDNIGVQPGNRFAHWRHLYTLTRCHDGAIFSVHWSRDGIIATGGANGMVGFFVENNESQVGGPLYKLLLKEKAHDEKVNSVRWSPGENRLLASTSDDETIKVWELEQANEEVQTSNPEANEEDLISIT